MNPQALDGIPAAAIASLFVETFRGEEGVSSATAFVAKHGVTRWLITNWHVVAGIDPFTGGYLGSGSPDRLSVHLRLLGPNGTSFGVDPLVFSLDLYRGHHPVWVVHPDHAEGVDMVAILINLPDSVVDVAYDVLAPGPRLLVELGEPLKVVGYPFGLTGGMSLPIWTSGMVATLPAADHDGLPMFLLDARTREGQSGSPVIAYTHGSAPTETALMEFFAGPAWRFVGVYSGRVRADSDLGMVWKLSALVDILERGVAPGS